ncbi:MAG: hypothetical protein ACRD2Z_07495 [Thermoanaerobaculia bacterium]
MSDDYLWDRSGPPDPEVERLESRLASFRGRPQQPVWPQEPAGLRARPRRLIPLLAAAAVLLVAVGIWLRAPRREAGTPWAIASIEGELRRTTQADSVGSRLAAGRWIETAPGSRVVLEATRVGQIAVEPSTRLRVVGGRSQEHRLQLAHGTLRAVIWAPPGRLVIDTPSSTVVDLGCAYTLRVDSRGVGLIEVTAGWVGFAYDGRESFIPAGAVAATRPRLGPGTPYYDDATVAFRRAVTTLDLDSRERRAREAALEAILDQARPRDALTLWHLLAWVDPGERSRLYDRLAAFVPPPPGVTRAGIRRGDRTMLDLWWNALGHGDLDWWRTWLQQWRDIPR